MAGSPAPVLHRHDAPQRTVAEGDLAFARQTLGAAAGTRRIGASLFSVAPGARQMPVHVHGDEEEIFFVVRGDGLSWEGGEACVVRPGDAVVHPPRRRPHTFLAGDDGLELLAFGSGSETSITYLPRARVMWCGPRWVPLDAPHPFRAEALAGALERPEPTGRPPTVVALADLDAGSRPGAMIRALGRAGGATLAGLNHVILDAGATAAPSHCHALEEELFVILAGSGTLTLGDQRHPLTAGDVVARPPSTRMAHQLRAGEEGLTYLAYGTREPGDSVYYPETGEVALRGLGVTLDVSA